MVSTATYIRSNFKLYGFLQWSSETDPSSLLDLRGSTQTTGESRTQVGETKNQLNMQSRLVAVKISIYRTSGPLRMRENNFGCGSYNCMHDIRFFYILCKPSSTILQEVDSVSAMRWHSLSTTSRPTTTGALTEFY